MSWSTRFDSKIKGISAFILVSLAFLGILTVFIRQTYLNCSHKTQKEDKLRKFLRYSVDLLIYCNFFYITISLAAHIYGIITSKTLGCNENYNSFALASGRLFLYIEIQKYKNMKNIKKKERKT